MWVIASTGRLIKRERALRCIWRPVAAQPLNNALISFAFATPTTSASQISLLGLSRDTSSAGSSAQRLEILDIPSAPSASLLERSVVITAETGEVKRFDIPNAEEAEEVDFGAVREPSGPTPRTPALQLALSPRDRGRRLSLAGAAAPMMDRNQTPRPSAMLLRQESAGDVLQGAGPSALDATGLYNLSTDMSVVLRERVEAGYGSDPMTNAQLSEAGVREFWLWVARESCKKPTSCAHGPLTLLDFSGAQTLSSEACVPE